MREADILPAEPVAASRSEPVSRRPLGPAWIAVFGPGLLVMLADTDAGNIVAAADAGARWGFRLLPLPLLLIPVLAAVQDLAVRIGLSTGGGFGALVRSRCGGGLRALAAAALVAATLGSLTTELSGIAGVGDLFGIPRLATVPAASLCLMLTLLLGTTRGVERIAIVVGLFELGFVLIAWTLHPSFAVLAADLRDQPLGDPGYLWLGAALIGATFNPWMIFYQGSALAERRLGASHYPAARWDTWIGAILTQLLTAAVLLAAAAAMGQGGGRAPLASVGQISQILTPVLGSGLGRLLFGLGVVGASLAAAIVCALACIWGLGELFGPARTGSAGALWFKLGTVAFIGSGALTVLGVRDLVRLSVALQVINAVLLPVVVALLFGLAATALPAEARPGRRVFGLAASAAAAVCAAGLVGAGASLF